MAKETNVFDDIIEQKLLNLHTCFPAKIISLNGNLATVQPLSMSKQVGKNAKKQAVISNIPIGHNARFKLEWTTHDDVITPNNATTDYSGAIDEAKTQSDVIELQTAPIKHLSAVPIGVGDVVLCFCGERDITDTKKGSFALPPFGHHEIKDAVIVCVLD